MAAGFKTATVRSGDVPATQTDFPTYVDLDRLGITTLAEAESVRVYADSAKTTEWAREIVSLTEMHVKVPSLTSSTEIFVDWDGVRADYAVTDTFGRNAVWTGDRAVYHLNNVNDSTSNAYNLTNNGTAVFNAAKISDGVDFGTANTTKSLEVTNDLGITGGNITLSGWVKLNTEISTATYPLMIQGDSGTHVNYDIVYALRNGNQQLIFNRQRQLISNNQIFHIVTLGTANWNYVALTYDGTTMRAYLNGVQVGTLTTSGNGGGAAIDRFILGADKGQSSIDEASTTQDETRVSSTVKTANWLLTEYNNQNDEATFWGTWTDAGGGGTAAQSARRGVIMMM